MRIRVATARPDSLPEQAVDDRSVAVPLYEAACLVCVRLREPRVLVVHDRPDLDRAVPRRRGILAAQSSASSRSSHSIT